MNKRIGREKKEGFVYKPRTEAEVKQRAEQTGGNFESFLKQGIDTWTPKDGENFIRILPPTWDGNEHYGYDIWVHSWVGPNNSTYLCPAKMNTEICPICKASKDALDAGDKDEAKQLQASKRAVVWMLDRDEEKPTPMVYSMSWSQDRDIASLCHSSKTGAVLLIDHPDAGFDVTIKRSGKGLNTRYVYAIDRETSPIHQSQKTQDEIIDYIVENPLPSLLKFRDTAYLQKVIDGTIEERDEDLDKKGGGAAERTSSRREEPRERVRDADEEDTRPARRESSRDEDERDTRRSSRDDDRRETVHRERVDEDRSGRDRDEDRRPARREREEDERDTRPSRTSTRDEDETDPRPRRTPFRGESEEREERSSRSRDNEPRRSREDETPSRRRSEEDEPPRRERDRDDRRDDRRSEKDSRPRRREVDEDERDTRRSSNGDDRPRRESIDDRPRGRTRDEEDYDPDAEQPPRRTSTRERL